MGQERQGSWGPGSCAGGPPGTCGGQAPGQPAPLQPHPAGHSAPGPARGAPQPPAAQPGAPPRRRACGGSAHPGHPWGDRGAVRGCLPRQPATPRALLSLPAQGPCCVGQGWPNPPYPAHLPCPLSLDRTSASLWREASRTRGSELTGTRAGCAGAHGRAGPGAGPRPASQGPGAWPRSAGCSGSGSQFRRRPGSEAPGRGQPPGLGPHIPAISAGKSRWQ